MYKYGNLKMGEDTLVVNMSGAFDCSSLAKGMCSVVNSGVKCYAMKAEERFPNAVPQFRKRQEIYWKVTPAKTILNDILKAIYRRKSKVKYFRYNESGDFHTQWCVKKLDKIAKVLKELGITTYGYSARRDLDFSNVSFLVKGSDHEGGNNGKSIVIGKKEEVPKGYKVCPGDCRTCNYCKVSKTINVAFRKH